MLSSIKWEVETGDRYNLSGVIYSAMFRVIRRRLSPAAAAEQLNRLMMMTMMMMMVMTSVMSHTVPVAPAPRHSSHALFHVRAPRCSIIT